MSKNNFIFILESSLEKQSEYLEKNTTGFDILFARTANQAQEMLEENLNKIKYIVIAGCGEEPGMAETFEQEEFVQYIKNEWYFCDIFFISSNLKTNTILKNFECIVCMESQLFQKIEELEKENKIA